MRGLPIGVVLLGVFALPAIPAETRPPANLALGKPYALSLAPNYGHTIDPGDAEQLTDGHRTTGRLWMNKAAVGWSGGATKRITIDLGARQPIAGVSFSTAAGVAGVGWPADLWVFVGDDNETWHFAGDLLEMSTENGFPPQKGYANHTFRTTSMRTHGRYVRIVARPDVLYYLFADEIEVYRGEAAWLGEPRGPTALADTGEPLATLKFNSLLKMQFRRDLHAVRQDVSEGSLTAAQSQQFRGQLNAMSQRVTNMPTVPRDGFRAVLPMTDLERDIFRLQASVWRAQGKPELRVWKSHRWDPLAPSAEPAGDGKPVLEVHMMKGEYRADVLNLTNASDTDWTARFRVSGLPGGTNPNYLQVHEVLCVGTRRFVAVSAALTPAHKEGDDYAILVPSGMTRQIWISFQPTRVEPGSHTGRITLSDSAGGTRSVEVRLRIYPLRFPKATTLRLGGWTYTDGKGTRGVTPQNRLALIAYLREHLVNAPWAISAAMPLGRYDGQGNMVEEPDTARFDEWVARWPGAACYMVFNALGYRGHTMAHFAGSKGGTEEFDRKVANWIRFWARHMRDLGLSPRQLGLLLFDEPNSKKHYDVITAFAKVINRTEPNVVLWVDPQPYDNHTCVEMMSAMDVLVPYRKQWLRSKEWFPKLFADQKQQGRELGFYSCDGPARRFDPFSYYLLQQWHCFAIGANWTQFWAFGDTSKADVWNEYDSDGRGPFTPFYLDVATVTGAKYMEAIREGVQDYEYLVMLREAITAAGARRDAAAVRAEKLLATACDRVLAGETRDNYRWDEEKDRSVADRVRIEVLETLVALSKQ